MLSTFLIWCQCIPFYSEKCPHLISPPVLCFPWLLQFELLFCQQLWFFNYHLSLYCLLMHDMTYSNYFPIFKHYNVDPPQKYKFWVASTLFFYLSKIEIKNNYHDILICFKIFLHLFHTSGKALAFGLLWSISMDILHHSQPKEVLCFVPEFGR